MQKVIQRFSYPLPSGSKYVEEIVLDVRTNKLYRKTPNQTFEVRPRKIGKKTVYDAVLTNPPF